jgi:small subunit ribosomal protein S1
MVSHLRFVEKSRIIAPGWGLFPEQAPLTLVSERGFDMEEDCTAAQHVAPSEPVQGENGALQPVPQAVAEAAPSPGGGMEAWLDMLEDPNHSYCAMDYGDIIEGTVMQVDEEEILVDIGAKSEGVVPNREFRKAQQSGELEGVKTGDPIFVFVLKAEDDDGRSLLSIDRARQEKSWRWLEQLYEQGDIIEATVDGYNKGGLLVNLRGVRGFVPASQVAGVAAPIGRLDHGDNLANLVGRTIPLKVIEINRRRNRLILSQRQALQGFRETRKEELLESLETGKVYKGVVSSICNFGVFVDLGGADGLVHLSELSWGRVGHPREVVQVGQEVDVHVLGIDRERKRIALSLRRCLPEPWTTVADRYHLGQLVQGEITQLATFGAFVRIEDGIEGLIHLSELSDTPVAHPREVVKEGDKVALRVIRIDPVHRRIGLSLRRALRDMGGEEIKEVADLVEESEEPE